MLKNRLQEQKGQQNDDISLIASSSGDSSELLWI